MTLHVLIACSKSKSVLPKDQMTWTSTTNIKTWNDEWETQKSFFAPAELYTGRSFKKQLEITESHHNVKLYIISAGAGLISLDVVIPSYESTFRSKMGPKMVDWYLLPLGGIEKIEFNVEDTIISFAPPKYHQALLNDPNIESIKNHLIVPSTSPLSSLASKVIPIHPRAKEVLGVSSSDLNTEFIRMYLSRGLIGFLDMVEKGNELPPKVKRNPISDEELLTLVQSLESMKTLTQLVRHLRDELRIKASVERISAARTFTNGE